MPNAILLLALNLASKHSLGTVLMRLAGGEFSDLIRPFILLLLVSVHIFLSVSVELGAHVCLRFFFQFYGSATG